MDAARRSSVKSVEGFTAFLGYPPSPAGAAVPADSDPVDALDEPFAFKFDQAASQALRRIVDSDGFGYAGECFRGDGCRLE